MTRSQSQKSTCKDLGRAGERAAITPKAIYAPVSNRAGSRFHKKRGLHFLVLRNNQH
ncbi:alpha-galactosidase [Lacticaseibacillus paracasei]|nr:alpha-galactosidase [Lacticaseibacillus paracasei]MCT3332518.1 alpha-galactosidase [Lacticaseibacillus paracasei]